MAHHGTPRKPFNVLRADDIPSMVGKNDLDVIERHLAVLPSRATIVEFGPWLGSISARLAKHGDLHVVDNFLWTSSHDKRAPGIALVGGSFRSAFEQNRAALDFSVTIHETDFSEFVWTGPVIDFCVIDAPKTPDMALSIFKALVGWTTPKTVILFKNALKVAYPDLVLMTRGLIEAGALVKSDLPVASSCNTLACFPGPAFDRIETLVKETQLDSADSSTARTGSVFQTAELIRFLRDENWTGAYEVLSDMPPDPTSMALWDTISQRVNTRDVSATRLATFSEMFSFHHTSHGTQAGAISLSRSHSHLFRAYWVNNADKPWRGGSFQPEILQQAFDYGYMGWPSKVQSIVHGKDIVDIGCGPGLHGIGYLAAGAKSYIGTDPIIKLDKDRVKNLTRKLKEPFGWTPREISAVVEPWNVTPELVQSLPPERNFDVATLHNVTEHLIYIEDVFREIALRLRPGGIILYNHHNFYTWNGHHLTPKSVGEINPGVPDQALYMDWNHISYTPDPEHYISRGLNRIRLDDLLALTSKYFDILTSEEIPTRPEHGALRLTDEIRARFPHLEDRDFLTQNLFVTARVKL